MSLRAASSARCALWPISGAQVERQLETLALDALFHRPQGDGSRSVFGRTRRRSLRNRWLRSVRLGWLGRRGTQDRRGGGETSNWPKMRVKSR